MSRTNFRGPKDVRAIAVRLYLVLSVSSSSWCLETAAACDCGTSWIFLLPFLEEFSNWLKDRLGFCEY